MGKHRPFQPGYAFIQEQNMSRHQRTYLPLVALYLSCGLLALSCSAAEPIVKPGGWTMNDYCKSLRIGGRDFWFTEVGVWSRVNETGLESLKQTGFLNRTIPGYINLRGFFPESDAGVIKEWAPRYLEHGWPFQTINYIVFKGKENYADRISPEIRELWIGDGQPEQTYRLEPVFHYFRTGKKWRGSSMQHWNDDQAEAFFRDRLMPRVKEELPFWNDKDHRWTHAELQKLSTLYVDEFWRGRMPIAWGMFVGNYHIATNMDIKAVGEKGATPVHLARARGMMRQGGGDMVMYIWRGHEPTERYAYPKSAWYTIRGDNWGMPLQLMRYYFFRPYLLGANMLKVESYPANGIKDIESDGQYELTATGRIGMELFDFIDRHPDRGTLYSPVGLMLDHTRQIGVSGATHFGYNLPYDDADQMNHGIVRDLLYPEPRHTRFSGDYFGSAPFGEIFDLIKPNIPMKNEELSRKKLLENYKVLFAMGGLKIDEDFAKDLMEYVREGGVLAIPADDARSLPASFLGCEVGESMNLQGLITSEIDGSRFDEAPFTARRLTLTGARPLYSCDGKPMVTVHAVGKGKVLVLAPQYLIQDEFVSTRSGRRRKQWKQKPLLRFVPDLFEHLTRNATPFEVHFPAEARHDTSFAVSKKGDGWTIALFNYSLQRELDAKTIATAKVVATYPPKKVPFKIICNAPVADVVEWYKDSDVAWEEVEGQAVIEGGIRGGEILVYEFQPTRIDLGTVQRSVNYALNRPVTASSHRRGFEPGIAVDGDTDNDQFWWSVVGDGSGKGRFFTMPQWLQVDLGAERTIDHIYIQFHTWPTQTLDTRLRIYKYVIEASKDGENWQIVLDESRNMDPALVAGLERWFDPVDARYVRLRVMHNTAYAGAQVVEMKVMGPETIPVPIVRKSLIPKYEVRYPPEVANVPIEKQTYLIDMKPASEPNLEWMPAGTTWEELCGPIKLVVTPRGDGRVYEKSLYAQANSEIVYAIPEDAKTFVAAVGQGGNNRDVSVVFKVFVDDDLKYQSPVYRLGTAVLPVVVDVTGGKRLRLVVTDAGDGIRNDYAWWAEPRFLTAQLQAADTQPTPDLPEGEPEGDAE